MQLHQMIEHHIRTRPDALATSDRGRRRTWQAHGDRVARLGQGLRTLGLPQGGRLAVLAHNSDRYTECLFAASWIGTVFVPINTRLAVPEIIYWLEDSGSTILCIDDDFLPVLEAVRPRLPGLRQVIYIGEAVSPPEGLLALDALVDQHAPAPAHRGSPQDMVGLYYTGGTTGLSKGVMLSHHNLLTNAGNLPVPFAMDAESRYLHAAPMFHIADAAGGFTTALQGAANHYVSRFDPLAVMRTIQDQRITHTVMVPTMINILVNHPELPSFDLSSLRVLCYGGSPMPEAVIRKTVQVLPQVRLLQGYGQTETSSIISLNPHEYHIATGEDAAKVRSAGRPVPGVEVRIVDANEREVPVGAVGEICARGATVMLGYWNKPEQTADALRNGWLHTGDSGTLDVDGFLYILDRVKDMIISGGENIYSAEVEEALYRHSAVAMCAVIGIPDDRWGEAVHAIVCLKPEQSVTAEELQAHCRTHIAGYKCPRSFDISHQALAMSGAGKILKAELRKPFWEGRGRQVN